MERVAAGERVGTAVQLSQRLFEPGVPVVYIVNAERFSDGLAGGAASAQLGGPVLLVHAGEVPAATAAELTRLGPGRIVVVGGGGVVSDTVVAELAAYTTSPVTRLGGRDRYDTAARVSAATFKPGVPAVYVATGADFADSLSGGPAAALDGAPLLLVAPDLVPEVVAAELVRLRPGRIVVLGGRAAVSEAVAEALAGYTDGAVIRLGGDDRYGTSALVSAASRPEGTDVVYIATGANFPDALASAPAAHAEEAALLLTHPQVLPAPVAAELTRLSPRRVIVLGGDAAVSEAVRAEVERHLRD